MELKEKYAGREFDSKQFEVDPDHTIGWARASGGVSTVAAKAANNAAFTTIRATSTSFRIMHLP